MAKIFKGQDGYEFVHLGRIGMQLVNEFQRHHPRLCTPTNDPTCRLIRFGSNQQNIQLDQLVRAVLERDPEIPWKPKPPSKARAL